MNATPAISVLIPARNEEKFIGKCLDSIREAEKIYGGPVEIVVALNRCTDSTEQIARAHGAKIVNEDAKNLSIIRNAAAKAAAGKILVTIDADSYMTPNLLSDVYRHLDSGKSIGGGVLIKPDRMSVGIFMTGLLLSVFFIFRGLSAGLFWCRKEDFEAIGGFNEKLITAEDLDFALRLKRYGKKAGKRFTTLYRSHIVSSCRKFDQFGDWYFLNPLRLWKFLRGDRKVADWHWYEIKR